MSAIQTRIKLRIDTLTNWETDASKLIYRGEAAIATDNDGQLVELRIGTEVNGSTWKQINNNKSNIKVLAENVVGLSSALYDYRLAEDPAGTIKIQKKLNSDTSDSWTDVTSISLSFKDKTDGTGYNKTSNPIALQAYVDQEIQNLGNIQQSGTGTIVKNVTKDSSGRLTKTFGKVTDADVDDAALSISKTNGLQDALNNKISVLEAGNDSVEVTSGTDGTAKTGSVKVKISPIANNALQLETEEGKEGLKVIIPQAAEYSIAKLETPESGFLATYQLTKDGTAVSGAAKINIPKDFLVKEASCKTCTKDDEPVEGYKVGDKYLDFVINTKDGSGTDEHLYIKVTDLIDIYTAGNGLSENNHQFSIKLIANGNLDFDTNGNLILAQSFLNTVAGKATKVTDATEGNIAGLTGTGDLSDTGIAKTAVARAIELATGAATVEGSIAQAKQIAESKMEFLGVFTGTELPTGTNAITTSKGSMVAQEGDTILKGTEFFKFHNNAWMPLAKCESYESRLSTAEGKLDTLQGDDTTEGSLAKVRKDLDDAKVDKITRSASELGLRKVAVNTQGQVTQDALVVKSDLDALIGIAGINTGLVKSSTDNNKVSVGSDGIMEVNKVTTDKLLNKENDVFIIDGGDALHDSGLPVA